MIKFIKMIIPNILLNRIRKYRSIRQIKKAYNIDRIRFQHSAFDIVKTTNQENLEARIIFHYHSLEKGLSNVSFREGFGERAYTQLINSMEQYTTKGFDRNSIPFQTGLSVLSEYLKRHKDSQMNLNYIKNKFNMLSINQNYTIKKETVLLNSKSDVKSLALNRFSVRDFSKKPINLNTIEQALVIARKTPSVCNRQPWHSHIIRDKNLIDKVLNIQKGLKGYQEAQGFPQQQ